MSSSLPKYSDKICAQRKANGSTAAAGGRG
jgi:hypothetical protein